MERSEEIVFRIASLIIHTWSLSSMRVTCLVFIALLDTKLLF